MATKNSGTITTATGRTFSWLLLARRPEWDYSKGPPVRITYDGMILHCWNVLGYKSDGRCVGEIKRLAKKTAGWPHDVEWFIHDGKLYYKS